VADRIQKPGLFSGVGRSLALVAGFVLVGWLGLRLAGIHFALISSLLISLALTAALQVGANAARRFGT